MQHQLKQQTLLLLTGRTPHYIKVLLVEYDNRASARADTQMTHRKESNTESGHNTKWLITANGPLQS